jgi:hypothetical protein
VQITGDLSAPGNSPAAGPDRFPIAPGSPYESNSIFTLIPKNTCPPGALACTALLTSRARIAYTPGFRHRKLTCDAGIHKDSSGLSPTRPSSPSRRIRSELKH